MAEQVTSNYVPFVPFSQHECISTYGAFLPLIRSNINVRNLKMKARISSALLFLGFVTLLLINLYYKFFISGNNLSPLPSELKRGHILNNVSENTKPFSYDKSGTETEINETAASAGKVYEACSLKFPLYYSDGAVFQMGPAKHTVWGFVSDLDCDIQVTETFHDGCKSLNSTVLCPDQIFN